MPFPPLWNTEHRNVEHAVANTVAKAAQSLFRFLHNSFGCMAHGGNILYEYCTRPEQFSGARDSEIEGVSRVRPPRTIVEVRMSLAWWAADKKVNSPAMGVNQARLRQLPRRRTTAEDSIECGFYAACSNPSVRKVTLINRRRNRIDVDRHQHIDVTAYAPCRHRQAKRKAAAPREKVDNSVPGRTPENNWLSSRPQKLLFRPADLARLNRVPESHVATIVCRTASQR